jgi:Rrf2 family transcriptional regulator, cysteine metabolism repressor
MPREMALDFRHPIQYYVDGISYVSGVIVLRITQRSEYAIQALLELALRNGSGPVTIADIAAAQRLPQKFLAVILVRLKQAGVVVSERGTRGGYRLARAPSKITAGQVVRLLDGPVQPAGDGGRTPESSHGESVLFDLRQQIAQAVENVLNHITLADLIEHEVRRQAALVTNYSI